MASKTATPEQAQASGYAVYRPGGGLREATLSLGLRRPLDRHCVVGGQDARACGNGEERDDLDSTARDVRGPIAGRKSFLAAGRGART